MTGCKTLVLERFDLDVFLGKKKEEYDKVQVALS